MSKTVNFYLDKGADFSVIVQLIGINRQPLDITGMEFASKAKFMMKDRLKVTIQCIVERPTEGMVRLYIPYSDTERMPVGDWLYDIEMTYPKNRRLRLLQGKLTVTDEATTDW